MQVRNDRMNYQQKGHQLNGLNSVLSSVEGAKVTQTGYAFDENALNHISWRFDRRTN